MDQMCVSCIADGLLYGLSHQVSPLPRDEGLIREVRADSQQIGDSGHLVVGEVAGGMS